MNWKTVNYEWNSPISKSTISIHRQQIIIVVSKLQSLSANSSGCQQILVVVSNFQLLTASSTHCKKRVILKISMDYLIHMVIS